MKDKTSASLEALTGLLTERQRYEEWLSALESRKSSTPDSVYQKVRADYQSRLKDVSDRLGARAGELKSHIDTLTISGLTASTSIGKIELKNVIAPYELLNLTLSQIGIDTIQVPSVAIA